jgi:hypothetical protein
MHVNITPAPAPPPPPAKAEIILTLDEYKALRRLVRRVGATNTPTGSNADYVTERFGGEAHFTTWNRAQAVTKAVDRQLGHTGGAFDIELRLDRPLA